MSKIADIEDYFSNLEELYNFDLKKEITVSEIDCEEFNIKYEEFEDDED